MGLFALPSEKRTSIGMYSSRLFMALSTVRSIHVMKGEENE